MCRKFEPSSRIPKPGTEERKLLDERFNQALKRMQQDPEYKKLIEACRRAGDVDLRIVINV